MRTVKGQSTVEYILLLAVVMLFVLTVLRHPRFKEFMGEDSQFFAFLKNRFIYTYRLTRDGTIPQQPYSYDNPMGHPSYAGDGKSRFFSGKEPYP